MLRPTQRQRDQRAQALIILLWAWAVLPRIAQTFTAPKVHQSVEQAAAPYSHIASLLITFTTLLLGAFCAFVIATSLTDLPRTRFGPLAALLLPWVCVVVRGLYIPVGVSRSMFVYPLVVISLWLLRPRLRTLATLGLLVGLTAVISLATGILAPSRGIFRLATGDFASEDKQVLPWGILVGIFTQGNNLAQFMVLGMPPIAAIRRKGARRFFMAIALFAMIWGASRSCMIAVGMVVLTYAAVRLCRGASRTVVAGFCVLLGFAAVVALPFLPHQETSFSNRGYIWTQSLRAAHQALTFGLGANWYSKVALTTGALGPTVFHGHNQFVQLLVTGGFVLVAAVAVMLLVLTRSALSLSARGRLWGVLYLVALAGSGLLEVSLVFVDNFILAPVVVIPLCYIAFGRFESTTSREPDTPEAEGASAGDEATPPVTRPALSPVGRRHG